MVQASFQTFCFMLPEQSYQDRWIESTFKGSDSGKFLWSAGKFYGDADLDKGKILFYFYCSKKENVTKHCQFLVVQLQSC